MRFQDLSIGTRLGIAFATLVLIIIGIVILGLSRLSEVNESLDHVVNDRYKKVAIINTISSNTDDIALSVRNRLISSNRTEAAQEKVEADRLLAENTKLYEQLTQLIIRPKAKSQLERVIQARGEYSAVMLEVIRLQELDDRDSAVELLRTKMAPLQKKYMKELDGLSDTQQELMNQAVVEAKENYENTRLTMVASGLVASIFAVLVALLISRGITSPLNQALSVAEQVAAGDLTSDIQQSQKDETGRLLQALAVMNQKLKDIVKEVRHGTDSMVTASTQIATGNLDLSSRTEEQASSLEETASSMEELTSTVKQNAEHSRKASELALHSSQIAKQGGTVVEKVVQTMSSINDSSNKIVDIISVIDGIAFQTNILALNAAVEAARAGEQGRGFAVVASEVRVLAQRSATAAKEIKELIQNSVDKVSSGSELVAEAGQTMNEVVASIQQVTNIVTEISEATREQSDGIEQVNQAVMQMDQVTQQNAALVEEAAAAAQSLQDQAKRLSTVVSVFRIDALDHPQAPAAKVVPHSTAGAKREQQRTLNGTGKNIQVLPTPENKKKENEENWETF
ncbi:chemotaxis protein [Herbaspirillum rubrisubalbicans]|uniref:Methyl-accepting chemotaxis protein n=1 Tax=Herbaspirillum rubrisubalbicans Os34 TaxID=1235827 RepID=A0A6M3ZP54_9BURK|nr:methyl-accepting chemotaxis protein [Herbaspirillum rubrisubalbicans]QJQ00211.1 methyl-accepting chemotaxis protein [Herbaspirillum rubrisubalbicans Os34]RAN50083.1 chemotaxis protein [Herbaspirillum rubrisubalbicans]